MNADFRLFTSMVVVAPCLIVSSDSPKYMDRTQLNVLSPLNPALRGNLGPATNRVFPKSPVDVAVGENKLLNDRTLCPDGRGLTQSEPSIAVSGNVLVAAFNDSRGICMPDERGAVGWAYSLDNGETWSDGGGLLHTIGDPWLTLSADGNTFYLASLLNGGWSGSFHRGAITENGIVWDDPTPISFSGVLLDKPAIAVNPVTGRVVYTFTRMPSVGIWRTYSDDGGYTWSAQTPIFIGRSWGSFPAFDSRGNLFVGYWAGLTMQVARSVDDGETFQRVASFPFTASSVEFMDRTSNYPRIAVDRSGGTRDGFVYVAWHAGPAGNLRPYISHSEDSGDTWTEPIPVNTDPMTADHWWPSVSVDANGTVNVVYLDRRKNPGTGLTDVFLSQSVDGAISFIDTRITDVTSSWEGTRADPGFTYAGDYFTGISNGTTLYVVWPDPRNGDADVYFSRIDTKHMKVSPVGESHD